MKPNWLIYVLIGIGAAILVPAMYAVWWQKLLDDFKRLEAKK